MTTRRSPRPPRIADAARKNLENPWNAQKAPFRQTFRQKNLFLINGAATGWPSFSKLFFGRFGRFQWVRSKKIWRCAPSRILFARTGRRQHRSRTCQGADYNRGRAFAKEIVWFSACKLLI